jgi:hypothetical protein
MTYEPRMDLCDAHPNQLKFARLRLDLSGCFTPRRHSIKAQNVIGRMERLRSLSIAQNQSRQTTAGARNP